MQSNSHYSRQWKNFFRSRRFVWSECGGSIDIVIVLYISSIEEIVDSINVVTTSTKTKNPVNPQCPAILYCFYSVLFIIIDRLFIFLKSLIILFNSVVFHTPIIFGINISFQNNL